jgi:copper resistance protein B
MLALRLCLMAATAIFLPGIAAAQMNHSMHGMSAPQTAIEPPNEQGAAPASGNPPVEAPQADQDMSDMPGMDMPGMNMEGDSPAEEKEPQSDGSSPSKQTGTDAPAGNAPPPPVPTDHAADQFFDVGTMDEARHHLHAMHGGGTLYQVLFNLAEYQVRNGKDGYRWDGEGWVGGDINRFVVKSEGEGTVDGRIESGEIQALYSRAISPYFDFQAGVRQDIGPSPARTYATIGFEGLAPGFFEVEGAVFVSDEGDILARLEGWYDQRITQRLILQPRVELNFAAQNVPESGIGSGISTVELGLRLRYEIKREFAPYIGVSWEQKIGDTARYARNEGNPASSVSLVIGVRSWF